MTCSQTTANYKSPQIMTASHASQWHYRPPITSHHNTRVTPRRWLQSHSQNNESIFCVHSVVRQHRKCGIWYLFNRETDCEWIETEIHLDSIWMPSDWKQIQTETTMVSIWNPNGFSLKSKWFQTENSSKSKRIQSQWIQIWDIKRIETTRKTESETNTKNFMEIHLL